jgi:integrase
LLHIGYNAAVGEGGVGRIQRGYIYEASGCFYVRYWATAIVDGRARRVQRSERLCEKNHKYYARTAKAVKLLRDDFMYRLNQAHASHENRAADMRIVDFWERQYLPYCENVVPLTGQSRKKPSTVRSYKQIWNQHLKGHFGNVTLQEYEPDMGTRFLESLTATQNKNTLRHIKFLGSSIFKRAINERRIKVNPWHDVQMPDDAIDGRPTEHYTWEEAENIITALVDHVECQLIVALACFLGLRPGEIEGLRWEDFDDECVHIRRSVVRGKIGTPKTTEALAPIPLMDPVRVPLELWRQKSGNPSDGWLFPSEANTPTTLNNFVNRIIKPTLKAKGIVWKRGGLYCGRRGACTEAIEKSNGNYALAQELLRHKRMTTTLNVYKKRITPEAFKAGMKMLEAATKRS